MFNIEKFHNELAMRLGYDRIVNDKRIHISVVDSDNPWVILMIQGHDDIKFKASGNVNLAILQTMPEIQNEINSIISATQQAYKQAIKPF